MSYPIAHCLRQSMFNVHGFESCTTNWWPTFIADCIECVISIDLQFLYMHVNHNTDEYFVLINSHQFDRYEILFFICTCKYVVQNLFSPSNNLLKIDIFTLLKIITIIYRFYLYFNFHAKSGKHKQIKCFLHCILLYGATRLTHGVPIVISQKISRVNLHHNSEYIL